MEDETIREIVKRIDENTQSTNKTLAEHIGKDENLLHTVIIPLWQKHQQEIGKEEERGVVGKKKMIKAETLRFSATTLIAAISAWAAVKLLR